MVDMKAKLLLTIVDEDKEREAANIYRKSKIPFKFVLHGRGSASSSILNYFGLSESQKSLIVGVVSDNYELQILEILNNKLKLSESGNGITISIPISSSNRYVYERLVRESKVEGEKINMVKKQKYHLIFTIIQEGFFEKVMDIAKSHGASGGTLINGRGLGNKEVTKFLGFAIEPEKDIVLMVVDEKHKNSIMEAITDNFGIKTAGRGICFSVPVDNAIGLEGIVD